MNFEVTDIITAADGLCPVPGNLWVHIPIAAIVCIAESLYDFRASIVNAFLMIGAFGHIKTHCALTNELIFRGESGFGAKALLCQAEKNFGTILYSPGILKTTLIFDAIP